MRKLFIILTFLIGFKSIESYKYGKGIQFSARTISGLRANWYRMKGEPRNVGVLAGFGVESAVCVTEKIYLAFEAGFPWYDQQFENKIVTAHPIFGAFKFKSIFLLAIPIFYPQVGFKVSDDFDICIGTFYVWGLAGSFRKRVTENFSYEIHWSWMLDRMIYEDGLHDGHFIFSIRYTF
jgi:hypothetical protein